MITTLKTFLTTTALIGMGTLVHAGSWTLDAETSQVSYGTIKKNAVGEVNVFEDLSGTVTPEGDVSVSINLASVETYIDIRNERMIEHVFKNAPAAELNASIEMAELNALPTGEATDLFIDGTLSFLGRDIDIEAEVFVARLSDSKVLVTTSNMLFLGTEDAGVDEGVSVLQEIAELSGITRTVPVTFRMMFTADSDGAAAATTASEEAPVVTASMAGDAGAGRRVFRQCSACHVLEAGVNRVGPSLHGLFGSTAGQVDGFRYSDALVESGIVWDTETLTAFLANPRDVVPGNRMAFRGVRDEEDLQDLLAYLSEELKG